MPRWTPPRARSCLLTPLAPATLPRHMARMSDIPKVLRSAGPWTMTKRIWRQVHDDNLAAWAAALSYSWLFAIFPFFIFLLSLLPYLPYQAKSTARNEIAKWVQQALPG